jgi:Lipocalin-like domain
MENLKSKDGYHNYLKRNMDKVLIVATFCFLIISCETSVKQKEPVAQNQLVGTWKFIADQLLDSTFQVIKEDTAVDGLLIYTPDGKMSVQFIWKGSRGAIIHDSIMKQDGMSTGLGLGNNTWSLDQARQLIDTYEAYFGDYQVDWNTQTVSHIISGNLRPDKAGVVKKRIFKLTGDTLLLRSADPMESWGVLCVRNR